MTKRCETLLKTDTSQPKIYNYHKGVKMRQKEIKRDQKQICDDQKYTKNKQTPCGHVNCYFLKFFS